MTCPRLRHFLLAAIPLFFLVATVRADETQVPDRQATELLPPSTLFYAELRRPADLLGLLDSPLFKKISQTPQYQQAWSTPQLQQLTRVMTYLEGQLGTTWPQALKTLTDGGVYWAFDTVTMGSALLIKTSDQSLRQRLIDTLIEGARSDAQNNGRPDPLKNVAYRGFAGYTAAMGGMISFGPWLLLTDKEVLAKWIIDSYLGPKGSLATDASFKAMRDKAAPDLTAWSFAKIAPLRLIPAFRNVFSGRKDVNLEYIAGGVIDALSRADLITGELRAGPKSISLALSTPYDPATVVPARKFFFAQTGQGSAPAPLKPPGTLLSFSAYRDTAAMIQAAPDLFDDNVATQIAQTDSQLSNFFSGRSFTQDILTQFQPGLQLLIARQEFDPAKGPVPALKLPAGALIVRVKDPQIMRPYMQLAFQTISAIINIEATMKGAPALMVNSEQKGDVTYSTASYMQMADKSSAADGPLYYNFTPTLAMTGDYVILTSTRSLAEKLVAEAGKSQASNTVAENTLLEIQAAPILAALQDNRSQLVAQAMVRRGLDKPQAERLVGLGLELASLLEGAHLKLIPEKGTLRLDLGLSFTEQK